VLAKLLVFLLVNFLDVTKVMEV